MNQTSENANAWESEQDDVWGDDDNVSYDRAIAEKEWSRLHETFGNVSSPTTTKKKRKKMPGRREQQNLTLSVILNIDTRLATEKELRRARKELCSRDLTRVGQKASSTATSLEDFEA